MEILSFGMPPSARIIWASDVSRKTWEPRIAAASRAFAELERLTVVHEMRECTTMHASPKRLEQQIRDLAKQGLCFLPLRAVGAYNGFAHSHPPVEPGKDWNYYGVVARNAGILEAFAEATASSDHVAMGRLLGYPECCSKFFVDVWGRGYVDPVWQAAEKCGKRDGNHCLHLENSTWAVWQGFRYIGVRAVPHLPCSFDCKSSKTMAESWLDFGYKQNIHGIADIEKLLQLSCEWDCYKGIAQIRTDHFMIVTNSVTCFPRHIVRKA